MRRTALPSLNGSPFSGNVFAAFGTAAAPGIRFAAEPNLGFYRVSAGLLGFASAGTPSINFGAAGTISGAGAFQPTISLLATGELNLAAGSGSNQSVTVTPSGSGGLVLGSGPLQLNSGPVRASDGSAAGPMFSFINEPDCGMYRVGANNIGLSAGGVIVAGFDSSGIYGGNGATGTAAISNAAGTATAPAYAFRGDTGNGIYRPAANQFGIATNSAARVIVSNTLFHLQAGVVLRLSNNYVAGAPAATGYVTLQDGAGGTMKLLCSNV